MGLARLSALTAVLQRATASVRKLSTRIPKLLHVDAFTAQPFTGNPAAVCILDEQADPDWMISVARNQNLSETAFVRPTGGSEAEGVDGAAAKGEKFELRWFTPTVEVDLCGHATLAAAHALFTRPGGRDSALLRFGTRSGELLALRGEDGVIELDFPASAPVPICEGVGPSRAEIAHALGLPEEKVQVAGASTDLLVVVPDAAAVKAATPDLGAISKWPFRGVIVSRFFAPGIGIDEDAVTGSAHCTLAPYWGGVLGKGVMRARQLSARGGEMEVEVDGEGGGRVRLRGQAVTTLAGALLVPPPKPPPIVGRMC